GSVGRSFCSCVLPFQTRCDRCRARIGVLPSKKEGGQRTRLPRRVAGARLTSFIAIRGRKSQDGAVFFWPGARQAGIIRGGVFPARPEGDPCLAPTPPFPPSTAASPPATQQP